MKSIITNPWSALITLFFLICIRIADPSFVESVRLRLFDQLVTSHTDQLTPIHVVNIDEDSINTYGQYPFSRDVYAGIIKDLYSRDAGLVVFNVLMPERDRLKQDLVLAETLKDYPVILPSLGATNAKNPAPNTSVQVFGQDPAGLLIDYPGLISSIPELTNSAAGTGVVNTLPEIDGVVRRAPLTISSNGMIYPSLAVETLRISAGSPSVQVKINETGIEAVRVPQFGKIATDNFGRVWIDWSQVAHHYSLTKLPSTFNKGIVIVGVNAAGLGNPIATSRGEVWPQDVHASLIGTMLTNTSIQRPTWADTAEVYSIMLGSIILIFLTRWLYVGIVASVSMVFGSIAASVLVYSKYYILVDCSAFAICALLVALHSYTTKFLSEFFQKLQIKKQFSSYVNPVIVEKLQKHPEFIKLGGEKRLLSIVMTDLRNFTGLGESYGDDVVAFTTTMNRYMTAISRPIFKNNGCLIKFIGDASLHVHGAPIQEPSDEDHAVVAVRTGLEMLHAVDAFNLELETEGKPKVGMGIGINTGPTLIGNIGAEQRFGYDVLGDSVSLTARLEGQTKNYGVDIIISESTAAHVSSEFFLIELDTLAVKGKTLGVKIFTVFYKPDKTVAAQWNDALLIHNSMLRAYRVQDWDTVRRYLSELMGQFHGNMDKFYALWHKRVDELESSNLSADWDGVYIATTK